MEFPYVPEKAPQDRFDNVYFVQTPRGGRGRWAFCDEKNECYLLIKGDLGLSRLINLDVQPVWSGCTNGTSRQSAQASSSFLFRHQRATLRPALKLLNKYSYFCASGSSIKNCFLILFIKKQPEYHLLQEIVGDPTYCCHPATYMFLNRGVILRSQKILPAITSFSDSKLPRGTAVVSGLTDTERKRENEPTRLTRRGLFRACPERLQKCSRPRRGG